MALSAFASPPKDKAELLARKWIMVEMQVDGKTYSEEMLERQRARGLTTILRFTKTGSCYIYIQSSKGRTTKKNTWKFLDNQTLLHIQPEESGEAQIFSVEKLSAKKLVLSLEDSENNSVQSFTYKAIK